MARRGRAKRVQRHCGERYHPPDGVHMSLNVLHSMHGKRPLDCNVFIFVHRCGGVPSVLHL